MRRGASLLLLSLGACTATVTVEGPPDGGGVPKDGGLDAGAGPDAGRPADGGPVPDAGPPPDAGPVPDAGGPYTLTVARYGAGTGTVAGPGGLSCGATCSASVSGTVTLTATASGGSAFLAWGGACSGASTTCAFNITAATTVTATFNPPGAIAGVFTWRYDNTRQGQNTQEQTLTPSNVSYLTFGKIAEYAIDGFTYAQPLYAAGVTVPGKGIHNIVYVATEHDSVYAFDADGADPNPLWQVSFIHPPSVTTVPAADTGETGDLIPEHGINGTPVIDPNSGTLFVVVNTKEAGPTYPYRLHALDWATGAEKLGGPVVVSAAVGSLTFDPLAHMQRPGLLLQGGTLYIGFGSHGDHNTYQGWVMAYSTANLAQTSVYCDAPTANGSAIWQSGAGLVGDGTSVFLQTANGTYDGTNMGDSVLRLSTSAGLALADSFTPSDQANLVAGDYDLGSAGAILLPAAVGSTAHPRLVLGTGKPGYFYLLDAANLGGYQSGGNDTQIVQRLAIRSGFTQCVTCGVFNTEAFWNGGSAATGTLFLSAANDTSGVDALRPFTVTQAHITAGTATAATFPYPGMGLSVSSHGTSNAILWGIEVGGYTPTSPAVLHAYDATNLSSPLYDSDQAPNGRDHPGLAVKFTVPVVANGRVFVPSQTTLAVYGLLP